MSDQTNALPPGYSLAGRYQIENILGAGGFGITYKGMHEALEKPVAIKEYFPAEWAYRDHNGIAVRSNAQGQMPARQGEPPCYEWGLQRFLDEAKILGQINHPGVVRVSDYFTANGSAYIVMEYEMGESLSARLQRGGVLSETELVSLLKDVLPALEAVHNQGYLHRDLKPSNLYMRKQENRLILIDFGAARQALGRRTRSVTSVVTPGYSPIEQYVTIGEDYGPWTDIYALGAVLYRCIAGAPPAEAPGRVLKDPMRPAVDVGAGLYSKNLLEVIDQALAVRPEERFRNVAAMREKLQDVQLVSVRSTTPRTEASVKPQQEPEVLDLPVTTTLSGHRLGLSAPQWSGDATLANVLGKNPSQTLQQPPAVASQSISRVSSYWALLEEERSRLESRLAIKPKGQGADALPLIGDEAWDTPADKKGTPESPAASVVERASRRVQKLQLEARPDVEEKPSAAINRITPSVLESLRRGPVSRRNKIDAEDVPLSDPRSSPLTGPSSMPAIETSLRAAMKSPQANTIPPQQKTRWVILASACLGAVGAGVGIYVYFTHRAEKEQQLISQQQEDTAAQRSADIQRRIVEINEYIKAARRSIVARNWTSAEQSLDRAAAIDPNFPTIAVVRAELKEAQDRKAQMKTHTDKTTGLVFTWVDKECFMMGSPATEKDRSFAETPHSVCVEGFWISQYTVSNSQYRQFKATHNSGVVQGHSLNSDMQPVVNVSWIDAMAFVEWLSWETRGDKRFRLPTEAEWERAARAGTTTRYYWGDVIDPRYTNFSDRNDPTGASLRNLDDREAVTAPVGRYLPNALDLYDMAGNVWQWTCSDYDPSYGGVEQRCSVSRPTEGQRAIRGGAWNSGIGELRSAQRRALRPEEKNASTGFRLVMELKRHEM